MRQLNLYLAVVWILVGAGILVRPDLLPPGLQPFHLQLVLFTGVMIVYNLTRWWLIRLQRRYRAAEEAAPRRRRHRPEVIDPTFDLPDDSGDPPAETKAP